MLMHTAKSLVRNTLDQGAYFFGPHRGQSQRPQLWILMYHRVLPKSDPRYALEEPGMVVEPETFAMHLDLLQQHFAILPLQEWLKRRHNGQALPSKSCAITFDDGWLDNFEYAFPILEQKGIPATIFAVTHMIGTDHAFWPNKLAWLLTHKPDAIASLTTVQEASSALLEGGSDRETLAGLIKHFKQYPDELVQDWLDNIDYALVPPRGLMNWDELRSMVASGLVDVGSHGCHHYRLQESLPVALIAQEIAESKLKLERELERPAKVFCYPNGDSSPLARDLVGQHYEAAVTTRSGINCASKLKPFELLRTGIHEDRCKTAASFTSRLANWY